MKDIFEVLINGLGESSSLDPDALLITNTMLNCGIKDILNLFVIVGMGMTIIYFLLEVNQKLAFDGVNANMKTLLAPLLKLFMAVTLFSNGGTIVNALISLNNGFIKKGSAIVFQSTGGGTLDNFWTVADIDIVVTCVATFGILLLLPLIIIVLICAILNWIIKLIWWYKSLTYQIEFLWRVAMFPLAFSDVYSGNHSNMWRYIKGFICFGIYGMALITLPKLSIALAGTAMTDGLTDIMNALQNTTDIKGAIDGFLDFLIAWIRFGFVCPFVALSASNLVRSASKEAFGA